jgi:DNA-binding transcriptional MocR family regulator
MDYATALITSMSVSNPDWSIMGNWTWGQGSTSESSSFAIFVPLGSLPAQIHRAIREAVAAAVLAADSVTIDPESVFIIGGIQ